MDGDVANRDRNRNRDRDRGQLVLVSGGVVAVALLAVLAVHAQLGYAGAGVATTGADAGATAPSVDDLAASIRRAVERATVTVSGQYDWTARDASTTEFRGELDPQLTAVERAHTGPAGVRVATNDSAAAGWALGNCPTGPYREFGDCVVDDGVVVQERAGETAIVAVVVDLRVATPRREIDLTLAVTPA